MRIKPPFMVIDTRERLGRTCVLRELFLLPLRGGTYSFLNAMRILRAHIIYESIYERKKKR